MKRTKQVSGGIAQRPTGITVFGVLLIIFSTFFLLNWMLTLMRTGSVSLLSAWNLVGCLVYLLGGIFALKLIEGARKLILTWAIVLILFNIVSWIAGIVPPEVIANATRATFAALSTVSSFVWSGLLIWYFTRPRVKEAFANRKMFCAPRAKAAATSCGTASVVLGILSIVFFFFYGFGVLIGIAGIICAAKQLKHKPTGAATAGLVTSIIGTLISLLFAALAIPRLLLYMSLWRAASPVG